MIDLSPIEKYLEGVLKTKDGYNFRCLVCGDSKKSRWKKRAYLIYTDDSAVFYCHNCQTSLSAYEFVKTYIPQVPILQIFKNRTRNDGEFEKTLPKIRDLNCKPADESVKGRAYLESRSIPSYSHPLFHYIRDCGLWLKSFSAMAPTNCDKFLGIDGILIHYTNKGEIVKSQIRTIPDDAPMRYITINYSNKLGVFGEDRLYEGDCVVTEGAFDAAMLENGVALGHPNLTKIMLLPLQHEINLCWDCEYGTNREITAKIDQALSKGYRVVHYGEVQAKDLNGLVTSGEMTLEEVQQMVSKPLSKLQWLIANKKMGI